MTEMVDILLLLIPNWSACLTSSALNLDLADTVIGAKFSKAVNAHNDCYEFITELSTAATVLDIVPPLKENQHTASAVAVALSVLKQSMTARIVAEGIDILTNCAHSIVGATKASRFVTTYDVPANSDIPRPLFHELQIMANFPTVTPSKVLKAA